MRDDSEVSGVVSGRHEQQRLHFDRQSAAAVEEDPLNLVGQLQLRRYRGGSVELGDGQRRGQLDQREGVAAGLSQQRLRHLLGKRRSDALGEEQPRRRCSQTGQHQRRYPVGGEGPDVAVAGGEDQRDRVGLQAARCEQQRIGRGGVQPVRVVHHTQHGHGLGGLAQHGQCRQGNQKRIFGRAVLLAERDPQRSGLRSR